MVLNINSTKARFDNNATNNFALNIGNFKSKLIRAFYQPRKLSFESSNNSKLIQTHHYCESP